MVISPDVCSEIVHAFDLQGWHRTGTSVDAASAEWLRAELRRRGILANVEPFSFTRLDPEPCSVSAGSTVIDGVPLLDSILPAPGEFVSGTLTELPAPDTVRLLRIDQHRNSSDLNDARNLNHRAIVVAVEGARAGQTLLNAWAYDDPFGPPVVQVPISAWNTLVAASDAAQEVTLRCETSPNSMAALNVHARVRGSHPDLPPLVVLTPRSGWWHCAGERGGGIATWLELAGAASTMELRRERIDGRKRSMPSRLPPMAT